VVELMLAGIVRRHREVVGMIEFGQAVGRDAERFDMVLVEEMIVWDYVEEVSGSVEEIIGPVSWRLEGRLLLCMEVGLQFGWVIDMEYLANMRLEGSVERIEIVAFWVVDTSLVRIEGIVEVEFVQVISELLFVVY
jgi:hypothetical protein